MQCEPVLAQKVNSIANEGQSYSAILSTILIPVNFMEKSSRVEHYSISKGDILVTTYALGKHLCEEAFIRRMGGSQYH